jgi:hypothetical protein
MADRLVDSSSSHRRFIHRTSSCDAPLTRSGLRERRRVSDPCLEGRFEGGVRAVHLTLRMCTSLRVGSVAAHGAKRSHQSGVERCRFFLAHVLPSAPAAGCSQRPTTFLTASHDSRQSTAIKQPTYRIPFSIGSYASDCRNLMLVPTSASPQESSPRMSQSWREILASCTAHGSCSKSQFSL